MVAIREKTGLTQEEFASTFLLSPDTIKNWEQGHKKPEGPARVLLHIIDKEPGKSPATYQDVN